MAITTPSVSRPSTSLYLLPILAAPTMNTTSPSGSVTKEGESPRLIWLASSLMLSPQLDVVLRGTCKTMTREGLTLPSSMSADFLLSMTEATGIPVYSAKSLVKVFKPDLGQLQAWGMVFL
jgi:hypothetical protein